MTVVGSLFHYLIIYFVSFVSLLCGVVVAARRFVLCLFASSVHVFTSSDKRPRCAAASNPATRTYLRTSSNTISLFAPACGGPQGKVRVHLATRQVRIFFGSLTKSNLSNAEAVDGDLLPFQVHERSFWSLPIR